MYPVVSSLNKRVSQFTFHEWCWAHRHFRKLLILLSIFLNSRLHHTLAVYVLVITAVADWLAMCCTALSLASHHSPLWSKIKVSTAAWLSDFPPSAHDYSGLCDWQSNTYLCLLFLILNVRIFSYCTADELQKFCLSVVAFKVY